MDYGPLLGGAAGQGTIGGVLAANLSGPRRIKAGAARDHFLGVTAVSGRGETFKSGGRVVKNVTGYDLCKLLAGSWGTLAAMTEVTVKVLPRAETEATRARRTASTTRRAGEAMAAAMGSSCDVSGGGASAGRGRRPCRRRLRRRAARRRRRCGSRASRPRSRIASRRWQALMQPFGALGMLERGGFARALAGVRDVAPFAASGPAGRAPLSGASRRRRRAAPKSAGADRTRRRREMLYDWAGGLIWVGAAVRR